MKMDSNSKTSVTIHHRTVIVETKRILEEGEGFESQDRTQDTEQSNTEPGKHISWLIERPLYLLLPYLHMKPYIRTVYFMLAVIFIASLGIREEPVYIDFLAGKHSFFNQIFAKFGWGWTFSFILVLRAVCLPLHSNWRQHLLNLLMRLTSLTVFFYLFCAILFPLIEEWTGKCVKKGIVLDENIDKKSCLRVKGQSFFSLDISGHSYLMTYCIMSLTEESKELIYVLCLGQFLRKSSELTVRDNIPVHSSSLSVDDLKILEKRYLYIVPVITVATLLSFGLCILWDLTFLLTSIYYHSFVEKVIGTVMGICTWGLQYQVIFPSFDLL